jgi:hypothetical protein
MKERATRGGMDEADEGVPGEAMPHQGNGALADRRPPPTQQWLEADPMLVDGPEFERRVREGGRNCSYKRADLFLKSACCSQSASACRGRGTCKLYLARTR